MGIICILTESTELVHIGPHQKLSEPLGFCEFREAGEVYGHIKSFYSVHWCVGTRHRHSPQPENAILRQLGCRLP